MLCAVQSVHACVCCMANAPAVLDEHLGHFACRAQRFNDIKTLRLMNVCTARCSLTPANGMPVCLSVDRVRIISCFGGGDGG